MTQLMLKGFSAAFGYRNFRYLWTATIFACAGRWMEGILLSWLVLKMTGSAFLTGVVVACRWLGYGLGPMFGAWADQGDRRLLLILITATSVVYSVILALLVTTGAALYWHAIVISLAASLAHGFDYPLRYALTADMVDPRDIANAVALSTVALDVTAILGPALAGPLIDVIGIGGVCWLLAGNYILNVWALYRIRGAPQTHRAAAGSFWANLVEGARYVRDNPPVLALLLLAAALNQFHFPLRNALVPVFADKVLDVGASGYGVLLASSGVGALIGAVAMAALGNFRFKAWLCIISSGLAGVIAAVFSVSTLYPFSLGMMGLMGLMEAIAMTTIAALLLLLTPGKMQGRVMGMRSFAILPLATGSLAAGIMAETLGAPTAGVINGGFQLISTLTIALAVSSLRRSG